MKRIVAIIAALSLAAGAAYADDEEPKKDFAVLVGADATLGLMGFFYGGQVQALWKPGFFGLAAGVRAEVNAYVPDVYIIPNAGIRLGWFGLEGGAGFRVNDGIPTADVIEAKLEWIVPFVRAGLSIPIGPISIDVGARVMPADTYAKVKVDSAGDAIAIPFVVAILTVLSFVKVDAAIGYVYRF